jgi:endonuclease III-like uncharacterized protein
MDLLIMQFPYYVDLLSKYSPKHPDPKQVQSINTTKLLDFVHRPDFYKQKTQRFGNWICFRNAVFSVCRNPDDGQGPKA